MAQKKTALQAHKEEKALPKKLSIKTVKSKKAVTETPQAKETPKAKNIGDVLRLVRESRTETIKDIGATLRISERYLQAIEGMNQEGLPEQVYALGFVRSYAQYLGVDPQKSVNQFRTDLFSQADTKNLTIPKPVESAALPSKKILWGVAGVLFATLIAVYIYWGMRGTSLENNFSTFLQTSPTSLEEGAGIELISPEAGTEQQKIEGKFAEPSFMAPPETSE